MNTVISNLTVYITCIFMVYKLSSYSNDCAFAITIMEDEL